MVPPVVVGAAVATAAVAVGSFISDLIGRKKAETKWDNQKGAFKNLIQGQTPFLQKGLQDTYKLTSKGIVRD